MRSIATIFVIALLSAPAAMAGTTIHVGGAGSPTENGDALQGALALARVTRAASSGPIEVKLAPGTYLLSSTLRLDVRDLSLVGSNQPAIDDDGWQTSAVPGGESKITVSYTLNEAGGQIPRGGAIIRITGDGVTVDRVTVDGGWLLPNAAGDNAIDIYDVEGFTVSDSRFVGGAGFGILTNRASGRISGNFATQINVGAGIGAGPINRRSRVTIEDNRFVDNVSGGLIVNGSAPSTPDADHSTEAEVRHNDLSGNVRTATFSFGLRIFVIRRDPIDVPFQDEGTIKITVSGNRIHGNEFGVLLEAGFPYRTAGPPFKPWNCDARTYTGRIHARFADNSIVGGFAPGTVPPRAYISSIITFTRGTTALFPNGRSTPLAPREASPGPPPVTGQGNSFKYLHKAHYVISDPGHDLAEARIDHPAVDRLAAALDPCPVVFGGTTLGNVLTINDVEIANTP